MCVCVCVREIEQRYIEKSERETEIDGGVCGDCDCAAAGDCC